MRATPADVVTVDDRGNGWRQVERRDARRMAERRGGPADESVWLVGWDNGLVTGGAQVRLCHWAAPGHSVASWVWFFPGEVPAAHRAFVAGVMPAPVFADWLEESIPDVPTEALAVLRGW